MQIGDMAPDFTLADKDGNMVSLSDFAGKKVVLYFYPKDNTPGCTRQACAFADSYNEFKQRDIAVIGISKDSVASHLKFAQNTICPLRCLPIRNCRRFKRMVSGRKRSFTAKSPWA